MNNLEGKNLCNPGIFMRHRKNNGTVHPGVAVLKDKIAWMGCANARCKNEIAVKMCDEHEFHVQKVLKTEFPTMIPKVYKGIRCSTGFLMYSEYIRNGTIKKHANDPKIESDVYKVFVNLKKIHDKYPNFRHNDLHTDNVLVGDSGPLFYDFGYANWYGNPIFDEVLKRDYGIFPGNNPMYDFHFFANCIYSDLPQKFKNKVLSVFPVEYIGENSPLIKNGRLRCDVNHSRLPTMEKVIAAFSPRRPVVLTFRGANKKTISNPLPAKRMSARVKFSLRNKRRASNRKANLMRAGMSNVNAELKAIRNIETLKIAGLLTPSPSPVKMKSPVKLITSTSPKHIRFASPVKLITSTSPKHIRFVSPVVKAGPVLSYTTTPRTRPRLNKKLCSSYKKDELMAVMKRLGHRVNKQMSIKEMCSKLVRPRTNAATAAYTRPKKSPIVNVRKTTYPTLLKKNLTSLAKSVGIKVLSKNKKGEIVNKLYARLNKNIAGAMMKHNAKTVTARKIAENIAKNYGWKNNRHVERLRLLKIYRNRM